MIRVALVGCGLVADQHVSQIRRVAGSEIVAVCDQEPLMAQQLADRFHIPLQFTEMSEMLKAARPTVVHITTPAHTHYQLAKRCLEAGCNVYLEKPFTISATEAEELLNLSQARGLRMTAGHNLQFSSETVRLRELVQSGFLGGPPVHIECLQCYSHDDPTYGKVLLGDRTHWIRSMPGSLIQNLISHGIAKIAEFLPGDRASVTSYCYSSPFLTQRGEYDLLDELRSMIRAGNNTTANFTFSTQLGAGTNHICVYGAKASILADSTNRLLVPMSPINLKSYLRYWLSPLVYAKAYRRNAWNNVKQFLRKDFHTDAGMKRLIELFYSSIEKGTALPISYREILITARIMDDIASQIRAFSFAQRAAHQ